MKRCITFAVVMVAVVMLHEAGAVGMLVPDESVFRSSGLGLDAKSLFTEETAFDSTDRPIIVAKSRKKWMKEAMGFGTSQFRAKEEGARICPNTASRRALKTITLGNGKIADEIIKNRPYKNKEELEKVMGPQLYRIFEHRIEIKEPVVDAKPHVKDTLPGEPPAREEPSGVEEDVIPLK